MKQTLLALLVAVGLASVISAGIRGNDDHGMGTLAGTVVNSQGKAVANASVTMQNADGQTPHATTTNKEGRFFFPDLVHGYYDVRASTTTSRSEWKHNVEIVTGKQTEVTLRLVPKPHPSN